MKEIELENVSLTLFSEGNNVIVRFGSEQVLFSNQTVASVSELLSRNFGIVVSHFKSVADRTEDMFDPRDIALVSTSILLHYLCMYNSWRSMYKRQENRDLRFQGKDFFQPATHDILFHYFKTKYPSDWEEKCSVLLGMDIDQLPTDYKNREAFYNK